MTHQYTAHWTSGKKSGSYPFGAKHDARKYAIGMCEDHGKGSWEVKDKDGKTIDKGRVTK